MEIRTLFPYAVAALQLCAGLVFLYRHEWRFAIVWLSLAIANAAFAGMR